MAGPAFPIAVSAVAIDLDGTLLDTVPDLAAAADAMLDELGRPRLGEAVVGTYVGKGIHNLVRRCLATTGGEPTDAQMAEAMPVFRRHYHAVNGRASHVFPGVREGLDALRAAGFPLGCVTNKPAEFTEPLLERLGLRGYFGVVVSGDTVAEKKPHPLPLLHLFRQLGTDPREGLLIGDSVNDVQAARSAGCRVFIVPYGYNEGADVRGLDCDAIVATLREAAGMVRRLGA